MSTKPTPASVRRKAERLQRFCVTWINGVDSNIRHRRQAAARAQLDVVRVALEDLPGLIELALTAPRRKG